MLAKRIGIKRRGKIDKYKVEDRVHGDHGWISFNNTVLTEKTVTHYRPDIILAEEKKNRITVVEVGVTSQENLEQVEVEKKHKYEALKKQMEHHKWNKNTEIRLIPYVMTCDGLVTRYHRNYRQELGGVGQDGRSNSENVSSKLMISS
ncbi:hypothetical protein X943_003014 [Babesia divergens]|uniref:Uncharacterized protein n=1 Tax=Babesia divergens TaxID=32595 RepID=A0AAD9G7J4_BABDI|nr:hypothetical protein X943_003014 [Babesia divergens]